MIELMRVSLPDCERSLVRQPSIQCNTFAMMSPKSLVGFLLRTKGTQIFINREALMDFQSLLDHPPELGVDVKG